MIDARICCIGKHFDVSEGCTGKIISHIIGEESFRKFEDDIVAFSSLTSYDIFIETNQSTLANILLIISLLDEGDAKHSRLAYSLNLTKILFPYSFIVLQDSNNIYSVFDHMHRLVRNGGRLRMTKDIQTKLLK